MDVQQPAGLALMRRHLWIAYFLGTCAAGFSESLPLARMGTPFRVPSLQVRWDVPSNTLPTEVWVFRRIPNAFSQTAISNLTSQCSLSDRDRIESNATQVVYQSSDRSRRLTVSFAASRIDYESETHYGPTNLTKGVPPRERIPELTTNFLRQIGIPLSEIETNGKGEPNFNYSEPFTLYYSNQTAITNVEWRAVRFRRALDGAAFVGSNCEIDFGEFGRPSKISFPWDNLEHFKKCKVADAAKVISWIQKGKAVQGRIPWDAPGIDWGKVKNLTVDKAKVCYQPTEHTVLPLLALWTALDPGDGKREVEIDCPAIDEAQP